MKAATLAHRYQAEVLQRHSPGAHDADPELQPQRPRLCGSRTARAAENRRCLRATRRKRARWMPSAALRWLQKSKEETSGCSYQRLRANRRRRQGCDSRFCCSLRRLTTCVELRLRRRNQRGLRPAQQQRRRQKWRQQQPHAQQQQGIAASATTGAGTAAASTCRG